MIINSNDVCSGQQSDPMTNHLRFRSTGEVLHHSDIGSTKMYQD